MPLDEIDENSSAWEKETLIAPFMKVKKVEEARQEFIGGEKCNVYDVYMEAEELTMLPREERDKLYDSIVARAEQMHESVSTIVNRDRILQDYNWKANNQFRLIRAGQKRIAELEEEKQRVEENKGYREGSPFTDTKILDEERNNKIEKLVWKINQEMDDISYFSEELAKTRGEISDYEQQVKDAIKSLQEWKKDIAMLCKSDCKELEIGLMDAMRRIEQEKQQENEKNADRTSKNNVSMNNENGNEKSAPESSREESDVNTIVSDEQRINEAEKRERVGKLGGMLFVNFDASEVPFPGNDKLTLEIATKRSEKIASEIQRLTGQIYSSKVSVYKNEMSKMQRGIYALVKASELPGNLERTETALQEIDDRNLGVRDRRMPSEVSTIAALEENMLKKIAFEKFCDIAIRAEADSFREEAAEIRKAESKRGISGFLGRPSKQDIERCEKIEAIVSYAQSPNDKPFKGNTYSYREIMAEMLLFKEEHEGDEKYEGSIRKVDELIGSLNSCFTASKEGINQRKELKKQEMAKTRLDHRAYRIQKLRNSMEKQGIVYRYEQKNALGDLRELNGMIQERLSEMEKPQIREKGINDSEFGK